MTLVRVKQKPFFNSLPDDLFQNFPSLFREQKDAPFFKHSVPVNVTEYEGGFKLEVIAPGIAKEDLRIEMEKNLLTISFEKKESAAGEDQKFLRREFNLPSFKRSFTLSENIDAEKIAAQYVNGVLTLNLPKKANVKPAAKQITIE